MIAKDIVEAIDATAIHIFDEQLLQKEYPYAFASDLMSDALAMIQNRPESVVLITGLCNAQVLRTAEMLDLEMVIFVRDKHVSKDMKMLADTMGINIFTTKHTMYETCGILYTKGLQGIHECDN